MAVCPSCRRPTPAVGRVCPHCGVELPGRTRLGSTPPLAKTGEFGATLVGHPRLESPPPSPDLPLPAPDVRLPGVGDDAGSEPPIGRRFEGARVGTWHGHTDVRDAPEQEPDEGEQVERAVLRPSRISLPPTTQPSALPLVGEEIRVRGPVRPRKIAVRARTQKKPWQKARWFGVPLPLLATVAGILGAGFGGALVAHLAASRPAVKVIGFEVTAEGRDLLTVSCGGCADGSTLRLGQASAPLIGGVAQLASPGLQVGENRLPLELESGGKRERIEVTVALAFRVSTDLRGITEVPPFALVVVSAPRGTSVTIGGTPIAPLPGVVRSRIDLSRDALGPADRPIDIERKVPVRVLGPELERSTHATIAASVVPLRLDATSPTRDGSAVVIAGRTGPRAEVQLLQNGRNVARAAADGDGRFVLVVRGHQAGPAQVAASTPGRLSRQVAVRMP
jgi:hypothetical protein